MTGNLFPARLRASHQDRRQNTSFRRNGKLQACEPCRKGKLRCDHMMPSCGRCTRRNKSDKCVYHPAPLTKTAPAPSPRQTSLDSNSANSNESYSPILGRLGDGTYVAVADIDAGRSRRTALSQPLPFISHLSEYHPVLPASESLHDIEASSEPYRAHSLPVLTGEQAQNSRPGQHPSLPIQHNQEDIHQFDSQAAFINEFAVLAENELSIGILPPTLGSLLSSSVTQSHIEKGAIVLTLLKDFQMIQKYIDKWYSFAGGFIMLGPMVKIYTDGIWSTWHKALGAKQPADLTRMSEKIWDNTLRPVSRLLNRHTTPREFCANVTGEFLRWEVVGLIVTLVSLLAQSLKGDIALHFSSHVLTEIQTEILSFAHLRMSQQIVLSLLFRCSMRQRCVSASAMTSRF